MISYFIILFPMNDVKFPHNLFSSLILHFLGCSMMIQILYYELMVSMNLLAGVHTSEVSNSFTPVLDRPSIMDGAFSGKYSGSWFWIWVWKPSIYSVISMIFDFSAYFCAQNPNFLLFLNILLVYWNHYCLAMEMVAVFGFSYF